MKEWITGTKEPFTFKREERRGDFPNPTGLYVHVPFCRSICAFCPYQKTLYSPGAMERYLGALEKEFDLVCGESPGEVDSLYFGGGSPGLLGRDFIPLMERIKKRFRINGLVGMELVPCEVTSEHLKVFREGGLKGISIGIQSFSPKFNEILGREAPDHRAMKKALASQELSTVDCDFIFGLPGQGIEDLKEDAQRALDMGATQISAYPFIDFTFAKNDFTPQGPGSKGRLLRELSRFLESLGLQRTAVWTFSLPGRPRYSSVTRDLFIGFGPSAVTLSRDSFSLTDFSVERYCERLEEGRLPLALVCDFKEKQRMAYYLFWKGYLGFVGHQEFLDFFGETLEGAYGKRTRWARRLGYVSRDEEGYHLEKKGFLLYHHLEQRVTLEYIDKLWGLLRKGVLPERLELG